jgi:hypothetical protein
VQWFCEDFNELLMTQQVDVKASPCIGREDLSVIFNAPNCHPRCSTRNLPTRIAIFSHQLTYGHRASSMVVKTIFCSELN